MSTEQLPLDPGSGPAVNLTRATALRTKKALLLLCVAAMALTSCARRYVVSFTHGATTTSRGKPRYDKATGCYVFTDMKGRQQVVPAGSVREIAPASMSTDSSVMPFRPQPVR